ncbi:MAG: hypothetical protein KA271_05930, partial [Propionivibrio sp.]|nr:hypothetical protein [Propionivibrio sp.]
TQTKLTGLLDGPYSYWRVVDFDYMATLETVVVTARLASNVIFLTAFTKNQGPLWVEPRQSYNP